MKEYIPTNVSIGIFYDTSQSRLVSLLMTPPYRKSMATRAIHIEPEANLDKLITLQVTTLYELFAFRQKDA